MLSLCRLKRYKSKVVSLPLIILLSGGCSTADTLPSSFSSIRDGIYDVQDLKLSLRKSPPNEFSSLVEFKAEDFEANLQKTSKFYEKNSGYIDIAQAILQTGYSPAYQAVLASQLESKAANQGRLPQISRQVSFDENANIIGRVTIDQTIFGNGRFSAQKRRLDATEVAAVADYELEANEQIAAGLLVYLNLLHQNRRVKTIEQFIDIYDRYLNMARARVEGGAAGRAELRLFELKKSQSEAELERFKADLLRYKIELEALTGRTYLDADLFNLSHDPWMADQSEKPNYNRELIQVPSYRQVKAIVQQRIGELEEEEASFKPSVSLQASFGHDSDFAATGNDFQKDLRLVVNYSQPLYWGKNLNVKALKSKVKGQQAELLQAERTLAINLEVQDALIKNYFNQMVSTSKVAKIAEERTKSFEADFKAGAVGMAEAVSVIETAKSIKFEHLDLLFLARQTDLQTAELLGLLGPLDSERDFEL